MWVKIGGHPCWRVQKALDEAGIEYELDTMPSAPWKRDETEQRTQQKKYPWIEFEDGSIYREESKEMAQRIADGKLAEAHTTPPTELLAELAEETKATLDSPQMLTGRIEGRLLEQLVHALQAKRVLELGTYSGYSSLSMAAGLPEGGHIDTCEVEQQHADVAQRYIDRSSYGDRITIHLGPALETIERLGGEWDFVFIDADKENYANYYEALLPRLATTGLMAIDNTLWSGRVLDDDDDSEATRAIRELNNRIAADQRAIAVQLTVRDGVTLIRRR